MFFSIIHFVFAPFIFNETTLNFQKYFITSCIFPQFSHRINNIFLFFAFTTVDTVSSMVTCRIMIRLKIRLVLYDLQNNKHCVGGVPTIPLRCLSKMIV
jgi:hypothetical protein